MMPSREEIIDLRENQGLTRERIAKHYEVSLATVRRWIKELNIPRPSKQLQYKEHNHLSKNGEIIAEPDSGVTLMDMAHKILGTRLTEKRSMGYILDGRPANTDKIIFAANLSYKKQK